MTDIESLRGRIREIDEGMLRLWKERDEAARRIGELKLAQGLPLQNFEVERAVLEHALEQARRLGLSADRTRTFVRLLIESALAVQEKERVRKGARTGRRALLYGGAGLMGSWFARFLEEQGFEIFVEDPKAGPYPRPGSQDRFDLILLATPPSTLPELLPTAVQRAHDHALIADIASVKGDAPPLLRRTAADGKRIVSLHPMFGPQAEVLMGRNVLLMDCGDRGAVEEAASLFAHTAARTHEIPLEEHDRLMAEVLGLSHATSILFNESLRTGPFTYHDLEPYGSTTFRKQVEVSREVALENPRLYFEIQTLNQANLPMLGRLQEAFARLRRIVEGKDRLAFVDLMHRAAAYYKGVSLRSR